LAEHDVDRGGFPPSGDERVSLETYLDFHRTTLLLKCSGLNGEQLASKPLPSTTLTLLGLVRHFAENERWWFRRRFDQNDALGDLYCSEKYPDGDDLRDSQPPLAAQPRTFPSSLLAGPSLSDDPSGFKSSSLRTSPGSSRNVRGLPVSLVGPF
jgi:hypothetical protein